MTRKYKPQPADEAGRVADEALLTRRLTSLGLAGVARVEVHRNRSVLVHLTPRGVLRIHQGYAYASDCVLEAIVRFLTPGTVRNVRRRAERELLAFPVHRFVSLRAARVRRTGTGRGNREDVARLSRLHTELNSRYFAGGLSSIPFRISDRMRTRLGEVVLDDRSGRPVEIGISRRHLELDGWNEVCHTVLHEMIHQWQAEQGMTADHGAQFRRKAREVGVEPRANRRVATHRRRPPQT